jgi:hypothetical protein
MAKTTLIKKEIDLNTSFLYDRKEVVTAPMWPNNSVSLTNIYTSSNQPHHQKIYYRTIFSDPERTGSLDVDFSIAYGHYVGSGSSTGSYGLISSSTTPIFPVSESLAIYSQYRSMLYESDKRKYLSDGKFRFYGLTDVYLGVYGWYFNSTLDDVQYNDKIKISDVKSFSLNKIKSLSCAKNEIDTFIFNTSYFINEQNRLFLKSNIQIGGPTSVVTSTILELATNDEWKEVSCGKDPLLVNGHLVAIKQDGTLWAWGRNNLGQLGIGYVSNENISVEEYPVQIGTANNWNKVYCGEGFSFALNDLGELYAWGDNTNGILGLGGTVSEYYPTRVGDKTWTKISIGNVNVGNESMVTIFGIDTEGRLWGWGDNSNKKLIDDGGVYKYEPIMVDYDTDWQDVSSGETFVIAIKGLDERRLYGWGFSGYSGELLAASTPDVSSGETISPNVSYDILNKKYLTHPGTNQSYPYATGWKSVSCGADFTFAINSFNRDAMSSLVNTNANNSTLWCWGKNDKGQLQINTQAIFGSPFANETDIIWIASPELTGWDLISTSNLNGIAAINTPNPNVSSMVSDDIYVINLNRWNFRDKVDAGNWQLSLKSVYVASNGELLPSPEFPIPGQTVLPYAVNLIDESINLHGTEYESPMYDVVSKGGQVYGVYSGSIETGINKSAENSPFGLFFPENGIIILNGELLKNPTSGNIKIDTRRVPADSSGAFKYSSNADMLYQSIKYAMQSGRPFIANTVETKMPTYCFIRINNDEFNYSTNPTLYAKPDSFLLKDKFREVPYPFTYVTTIGLYNDEDDLLAVAKLSRPVLKTPSTELVVKVKLDI